MRHFSHRVAAFVLSLTTAVASTFAASNVNGPDPDSAQRKETLDKLLAAGDTDSLVTAAVWSRHENLGSAERNRLLHAAVKGAGDSAYAYWLIHQVCQNMQPCDSKEFAQELRRVDPANGAVFVDSLNPAKQDQREDGFDPALVSIANSGRIDIYWNASVRHMASALARTGAMDIPTATVTAIGIAAALPIPQLQGIGSACKSGTSTNPKRLLICRRVAAVLRRGDTYLMEMFGIQMATATWPSASAQYQEAESAHQLLRYRMKMQERLFPDPPWTGAFATAYLDALSRNEREQDSTVELMTKAGIAPDPDPEWLELNP